MSVMIVTSLGEIVLDLFTDRCPLTCKNFLKLCKIKYYNGCLFHTVQKDFTAQTGDPTGTGSGGDSVYKFLYGNQARFFGDEIHLDIKHSKVGTVAMASAGENLNASQFYITLRDDLDYLDGKHTVFAEVAEGLDTLMRINEAYVDEKSRPYKNIRIKHTYILYDPFDDPPQLAELIPDASPEGKPKDEVDDEVRLEDDWVPMDEQLNPQELEEVLRAKDAHSRAVVLETVGDIPDAEIKPPDNVLFVCKLNPVTEDADLNTIFARYGVVTSADIIRDHKTGDSLCYAFIEFEDKDACEEAYYKMDNALIDDRRIHVDFSQSVAKLWSQYRRKGHTGGGCFKCGALDHMAKDCKGDSSSKQPHSKYTLKDSNTQHGGNGSTKKMRTEAQDKASREETRAEELDEKPHSRRNDDRRGNTHDWHRRDERNKDRRNDGRYERRERSPQRGGTKDYPDKNSNDGRKKDGAVERRSRDAIHEREHKRSHGNDVDHKDRSDETYEREHKQRHGSDSYKHRVEDKAYENHREDAGHGHKHNDRKHEKRYADDVGSRDRKYEHETRKRDRDEDRHGSHRDKREAGDKRSSRGNDHREHIRK